MFVRIFNPYYSLIQRTAGRIIPAVSIEKTYSKDIIYAMYPDVVKEIEKDKLNYKFIKKHGTCSTLHFYAKVAWFYRKKITFGKLAFYLRKKANLAVKRGFN